MTHLGSVTDCIPNQISTSVDSTSAKGNKLAVQLDAALLFSDLSLSSQKPLPHYCVLGFSR